VAIHSLARASALVKGLTQPDAVTRFFHDSTSP
jgi:hypothetical protein